MEEQQSDSDIGPELRQKLIDFEVQYNDLVRDGARSSLHPGGSALFASQATASPSKLSVPSRKPRNQASPQTRDIQFAAEIGTSLISRVRDLQIAVAEKEDALRTASIDRAKLEAELEGLRHRVRNLDESEQRYKDENWNLETQIHELMAEAREAADREQKISQALNAANAEKNVALRELDETKQSNGKLVEDHSAYVKHHDSELSSLRRSMVGAENEKEVLQRKVQELTTQNQELARAVAARMAHEEARPSGDSDGEDREMLVENTSPEHSPPPSPTKGTPRHNMLESETLKSSLHHAHRMIQNLKGTIHREKTEKVELKRMLQEARDELDVRRTEGGLGTGVSNAGKRRKPVSDKDVFKKPAKPNLLGMGRNSRSEVLVDDAGWEDHDREGTPSHRAVTSMDGSHPDSTRPLNHRISTSLESAEGSEAFETANERDDATTETDAFQTGAESLAGESSDETETEGGIPRSRTVRGKPPLGLSLARAGNRDSYLSTASTSGEEDNTREPKTPVQAQPRYRIRINRGANFRRSKSVTDAVLLESHSSSVKDSPASFVSNNSQNASNGQTLFAELADLNGEVGEDGESTNSTPNRPGLQSRTTTSGSMSGTLRRSLAPPFLMPLPPKADMTDAGTMTEPEPVITGQHPGLDTVIESEPSPTTHFANHSNEVEGPHPGGDLTMQTEGLVESAGVAESIERSPTMSRGTPSSRPVVAILEHQQAAMPLEPKAPSPPDISPQVPVPTTSTLAISPMIFTEVKPRSSTHSPPDQTGVHQEVVGHANAASLSTSPLMFADIQPRNSTSAQPNRNTIHSQAAGSTDTARLSISPMIFAEVEPRNSTSGGLEQPGIQSLANGHAELNIALAGTGKAQPHIVPTSEPFSFSPITVEEITPIAPMPIQDTQLGQEFVSVSHPDSGEMESEPFKPEVAKPGSSMAGLYTSVLAWAKPHTSLKATEDQLHKDANGLDARSGLDANSRSKDTSRALERNEDDDKPIIAPFIETVDQGSQTLISADQIEILLHDKNAKVPVVLDDHDPKAASLSPSRSSSVHSSRYSYRGQETHPSLGRSRAKISDQAYPRQDSSPSKSARRPNSAGSIRSSSSAHPPLPPDHKQAIAAASQRAPSTERSTGLMGPPPVPASAYKSHTVQFKSPPPSTPVQSSPDSKAGTTPRARIPAVRSDVSSALTRRSSASSFASELDQRFHIRDRNGVPYGLDGPGTDPQMIQAITQTMIGEYFWKYTRKAGRGELSGNRHRRFFWVHPYTRTLYWGDQNPASGGRSELKAKSVSIEAVRVVSDDNPMPPGLHRKSLVVVTPGRTIKFTATTNQRHTTWFNALSYLLLRTGAESGAQGYDEAERGQNLTTEDVNEFNPSHGQYASSVSESSARNPSRATYRSQAQGSVATASHRASSQDPRQGSMSRLSQIFRPASGLAASFASRRGRQSAMSASAYQNDDSNLQDSAEDVREVLQQQQQDADRLENVRACCDGKHDVGSLAKRGSRTSRHSQVHAHHHHHPQHQDDHHD